MKTNIFFGLQFETGKKEVEMGKKEDPLRAAYNAGYYACAYNIAVAGPDRINPYHEPAMRAEWDKGHRAYQDELELKMKKLST